MNTVLASHDAEVINKVKVVFAEMLGKEPREIQENLTLKDLGANILEITTALEMEFAIGLEPFNEDVTVGYIIWVILHTLHPED